MISRNELIRGRLRAGCGLATFAAASVATAVGAQTTSAGQGQTIGDAPSSAAAAVVPDNPTQPGPASGNSPSSGDIVVTGSRVTSNGFSAPTPVTVVTGAALLQQTPTTIGEALNRLPQFANSVRPSTSQFAPESGAATQLNLRSLGPQRGLILLDGRRLNPSTASGAVDISVLPEELVKRVDIVTGGASAAYGSDAVAGVVNFILDTGFNGLKGSVQGGITQRGDNANEKVSLTYGTSIGEKLHLVASGEFYDANGIKNYRDRDWFRSCAAILNPAGTPVRIQACNVRTTLLTEGGLITATSPTSTGARSSLIGTQFLQGGVPAAFPLGTLVTGSTMVGGGNNYDEGIDMQPQPALRRATGFAHLDFNATDHLSFFAEGLYGYSRAVYNGTLQGFYSTTSYTIFQDNAFLPAATRALMQQQGVQSFTLAEQSPKVGAFINDGTSRTKRITTGFKADVGGRLAF